MLRKSREKFFNNLETDIKQHPKRLWKVLKARNFPDIISSENKVNTPDANTLQRTEADNPHDIANMFNKYFASVFYK